MGQLVAVVVDGEMRWWCRWSTPDAHWMRDPFFSFSRFWTNLINAFSKRCRISLIVVVRTLRIQLRQKSRSFRAAGCGIRCIYPVCAPSSVPCHADWTRDGCWRYNPVIRTSSTIHLSSVFSRCEMPKLRLLASSVWNERLANLHILLERTSWVRKIMLFFFFLGLARGQKRIKRWTRGLSFNNNIFHVPCNLQLCCVVCGGTPPSRNQPARFNRNVVSISAFTYNHAYYTEYARLDTLCPVYLWAILRQYAEKLDLAFGRGDDNYIQ